MKSWRRWTDEEDAILARLYGTEEPARIAKRLGRSRSSVVVRAQRNGLMASQADGVRRMEKVLPKMLGQTDAEIGLQLGMCAQAVKYWRRKLGLRKAAQRK